MAPLITIHELQRIARLSETITDSSLSTDRGQIDLRRMIFQLGRPSAGLRSDAVTGTPSSEAFLRHHSTLEPFLESDSGLAQQVSKRQLCVLPPRIGQVLRDEFAEAQPFVQLPDQNQTSVGK